MSQPDDKSPPLVTVREDVIRFLLGENKLDGYWYGDVPAQRPKFWWRTPLKLSMHPFAVPPTQALNVPMGETCWLLEQTSTEDGKRRFWNGDGFGWDALKAARYPDKDCAERLADSLNRGRLAVVHGRAEVCGHMFQCGISTAPLSHVAPHQPPMVYDPKQGVMVKPGARDWVEEELKDGDRLCAAAKVERTEGGRLPVAKIVNALREQGKTAVSAILPMTATAEMVDAGAEEYEQFNMRRDGVTMLVERIYAAMTERFRKDATLDGTAKGKP